MQLKTAPQVMSTRHELGVFFSFYSTEKSFKIPSFMAFKGF